MHCHNSLGKGSQESSDLLLGLQKHIPRCLLLLLLSRFSHVRFCVTPWTAAYQAPPSVGFSRQEHWSGLPFPSPMHERGKWNWSHSVMSDSLRPHGLQPTRLLHPWDFPGKSTGVGCHCLLPMPDERSGKFRWNLISVYLGWGCKLNGWLFPLVLIFLLLSFCSP